MPRLEVADIFRAHGPTWRCQERGHLSLGQLKVMSAVENCRSAALGGHALRCSSCAQPQIAYNSCRNRHCPKCQGSAAQRWLQARSADLLPVEYYHVVFTLPAPLSALAYTNKEVMYGLLFDIAAQTLRSIAADPKHLGARIGLTLVLHTWGSALTHHPHVHGIVPGGGFALDAERWVPCRPGFFLSVRVLSRLFRRRFLEALSAAQHRGQLQFLGEFAQLSNSTAFAQWLAPLRQCEWVVYAKRPFAGPEAVLAYLSRYTHRVAISNSRLLALDERGTRHKTDRRVHASLLAACVAIRLSPCPSLRLARSRSSPAQHCHGTRAGAGTRAPGPSRPAGLLHTASITVAEVCVPTLRRTDAHHRDLRARPAHPRPAHFERFTLSARRSPRSTAPPTLHHAVARAPMPRRPESRRHRNDLYQQSACTGIPAPHPPALIAQLAHHNVDSHRTAGAQIPIAHRRY